MSKKYKKEPDMQMAGNPPVLPKSGKVAFQQGLFFGLVLAGINDTLYVLNSVLNQTPATTETNAGAVGTSVLIGFGVGCLIFLLSLGAYFGAGILAARQTGRVSTGTFAGMWAGAIYGFIDFLVKVVIQLTITIPADAQSLQGTSPDSAQSTANILGVAGIVGAFLLVLVAVGLGAGLGSLGGLIGRSISKVKPPERMLVPYPGSMYGAYPLYGAPIPQPGQPFYPAPMSFNDGYAVPLYHPGPGYAPPVAIGYGQPAFRPQIPPMQQPQQPQPWVQQPQQDGPQVDGPKVLAQPPQEQVGEVNAEQQGQGAYQDQDLQEDRTQRLNPQRSSWP
jgi:hypothetical protein